MSTIKEILIKDPSGSSYSSRDVGAEAQYVDVSYDASGNIIEDITAAGATVDHTEGIATTVKNINTDISGKAPTNHASSSTTYGVASTSEYGHVKVGDGLNVTTGQISVAYGSTANTACEGNDSRLSNARNTPNKVTFNNGGSGDASGAEFNGSAAKTVSYNTIGAAPKSHASTTTDYGVASGTNYGHVKTSTGITNSSGTISVAYGTTSATACVGNDSRLSNSRTPVAHASSATTYGVATGTNYGHVKTGTGITNSSGSISVTYGTTSGTACQGNDSRLSNARTPSAHATTTTAYGGGTASNFGHVKLSDTYSSNVGAAANSIGASQTALYNAYTILRAKMNQCDILVHNTAMTQNSWTVVWIDYSGYKTLGFGLMLADNPRSLNMFSILSRDQFSATTTTYPAYAFWDPYHGDTANCVQVAIHGNDFQAIKYFCGSTFSTGVRLIMCGWA